MSARVTIVIDGRERRARAFVSHVTLDDARTFEVREEEGRLVVSGPDGAARGVAARAGETVWVSIDGWVFECRVVTSGRRAQGGGDDLAALSPPMPATVARLAVGVGDVVRAGDVLIALEAMKMELPVRAPRAGTVTAIHCREGDLVQPGTQLIELGEPGSGLGSKP